MLERKNEIDVQYESIKKIEIYEYTVYKFKKNKIDEIDDYAYLYKNENLNWKGKMVREKPDHAQQNTTVQY